MLRYRLSIIITFLIILRLPHFETEIDSPHAWRQCDTHQYITSFHQEGIDVLHPSVSWMGSHKTLALECPIPEVIVALAYTAFGEHLWLARAIFLLFFAGCLWYLYQVLKLFYDDWIPEISILLFGLTPLALFYSRAIHVDFFSLGCAFAMFYYYSKGVIHTNRQQFIWGTIAGILAFMVKSPYAFYLAIPMIYVVHKHKQWRFVLKNAYFFVLPIIAALLWNWHAKSINAQAPDWSFIPGFNNFTDMWYWYFGPWEQREINELWLIVYDRLKDEVLGLPGMLLLGLGGLISWRNKHFTLAALWLLGSLAYLLIFFNLNLIHNYYQMPFLAPFALLMAIGIVEGLKLLPNFKFKFIIPTLLIIWFAQSSWHYSEDNYYIELYDQTAIANAINAHSDDNDLVITVYGGLSPQCPNILHRADRYGWSIPIQLINEEIINCLKEDENGGATKLAIAVPDYLPEHLATLFFSMKNPNVYQLPDVGLNLFICDIEP